MGFLGSPDIDWAFRGHQRFPDVEIWIALLLAAGICSADGSWRGDSSEAVGDKVVSDRSQIAAFKGGPSESDLKVSQAG